MITELTKVQHDAIPQYVEKWLAVELNSGKDVVRGNLFQKARQVAGLLVPLTVSIFENTEQFSKRLHDEADRKQ